MHELCHQSTVVSCALSAGLHDVVHERTGEKIAGAAQKRNKNGLLFQGSIWRPACGAEVDWDKFHDDFAAQIAAALGGAAVPAPWPDFAEEELSALVDQYTSAEWNEFR